MAFVDVIAKKRDGHALSRDDIDLFIDGVTAARIPDYQASALLMAIVLRGMDAQETSWLTAAMARSGERLDLSDVPGAKVGKHSTGGVGDKVSLILAPLVAACGVIVPKMSGRGLGHTGGTLDKLESIPGFCVDLTVGEFKRMLRDVGASIIGQTKALAPADKHLYALRDVTATVPSIPLIAASVMSKKLAEGCDALVLDVKCGAGAFMHAVEDARALAEQLVSIGREARIPTEAFITNMDAPLGRAVGNALEIIECVETLKGRGPADLTELVLTLANRMVALSGRYADEEIDAVVRRAFASGAALEKFRAIVEWQGGDASIVDDYSRLPGVAHRQPITADRDGYVTAVRADLVGCASMALGAGRQRLDDVVDHGAGVLIVRGPGERVRRGEAVLELLYNDERGIDEASQLARAAIRVGDEPPPSAPLVIGPVR